MQRIINALVQYRNPIIYILLMVFSILFLSSRSSFHKNKLEHLGFYISSSLYDFSSSINQYFNLKEINEILLKENTRLKSLNLKVNAPFLYNKYLVSHKRFPFLVKDANVIKNSHLNQRNYIIIDKGSENGVKTEMGVITTNGVLGIVKSVSRKYASVISILHKDLKINVRLKNSAAFGSLVWKGKNPREFAIEDVVSSSKLNLGDTIVTGGMSSYFPYGIPLGKISKLENDNNTGYYTLTAELFENPSQIYLGYVIENKFKDEIELLNKDLK